MARKVKVVTTSLATFEDVKPPYNLRHPEPVENLRLGLSLVDAAGAQEPDLIVLPETFIAAGIPSQSGALVSVAESIPGPAFDLLAERAQRYQSYIVAGLPLSEGTKVKNVAVLIDRGGKLVGLYAKMHPTEGELESGVVPGTEVRVFDTDFGRVALSICFDLNWPSMWAEMGRMGAEVVCWLSAYPGGFPLFVYAWQYRYRIISSVWDYEARVVDITGRALAQTTRWARLAIADLDLDKRLFNIDGQYEQILQIRSAYGNRVSVETLNEEHMFALTSCDPSVSLDEIIAEFGLIEHDDYIARCSEAQLRARHHGS
jgi:beta-ureidopropionase